MRCEELGCDLVEVTAHYGARPSHAEWQGQVYSLSGETQGYDKLSDATGYGTGDGLMGWNCRHSFAPFFEGSKRSYTDEQLREMKEHTVTYNGEKMTDYEASQLQRSMERDIRKTKRELTALDELQKNKPTNETKTEFAALSVKLKNQEAKLKNFCKQTERRLDTTRTGVFASQSGMGFGRSTSMKAVWANHGNSIYFLGEKRMSNST
ncbi:MAG: phage minor capsid protein, partial [Clostridia bacterium]|nr:phage minor capsid protein [Clostridia bacterium]